MLLKLVVVRWLQGKEQSIYACYHVTGIDNDVPFAMMSSGLLAVLNNANVSKRRHMSGGIFR